jgi:hypothetical protein
LPLIWLIAGLNNRLSAQPITPNKIDPRKMQKPRTFRNKIMEPSCLIVMSVLKGMADGRETENAPRIPEPDFVPFNFSYLRGFSCRSEQEKNASRKFGPNVSNALAA